MKTIFAVMLALALSQATAATAGDIIGRARIVDGDTFDIRHVRIRLWGVDAPEGRQTCRQPNGRMWPCGAAARVGLARMTANATVRCHVRYRDPYDREVATCDVDGTDLGRALVREGWALDYPHFSKGVFQADERRAREQRTGVWQGALIPPWEWRARQQQDRTKRVQAADLQCRIKGNINARGQRIAHAPGQRDYGSVRIDPARGERWFCTMAAATAAGWRPAKR